MANEEHKLSPAELADKAYELSEKIRTAIFTTWDGEQQRARPLSATVDRDEHAIYFLVGVDGGKTLAEAAGVPALSLVETDRKIPHVSLAFADHGKTDYVTIIGEASVSNDRAKIKELWTPFAKAWWDSENDPRIRLITVVPEAAEIWEESQPSFVAGAIMLTARRHRRQAAVGDHGAVVLYAPRPGASR